MDGRTAAEEGRVMGRPQTPAWQPQNITSKQDAEGRWEARTRFRDAVGHIHFVRRSGRTKGAAEQAVRRAIAEKRESHEQASVTGVLTVADLALAWLESRKPAPVKVDPETQEGGNRDGRAEHANLAEVRTEHQRPVAAETRRRNGHRTRYTAMRTGNSQKLLYPVNPQFRCRRRY
jgi:hypothetical protein